MPFRFNAKRVFLTYPQCDGLSKQRVLEFLRDERSAVWYCVGMEDHKDGGDHIHAYAVWHKRLDVCDERYFDVDGFHPNVQPVRNPTRVLRYCQKGGDHIGNCEAVSATAVRYGEIIRDASGVDDFLDRVVQHHPRDIVLHLERVQQFANWKWADKRVEYVPEHTTFSLPQTMSDWVDVNLTELVCILSCLYWLLKTVAGGPQSPPLLILTR